MQKCYKPCVLMKAIRVPWRCMTGMIDLFVGGLGQQHFFIDLQFIRQKCRGIFLRDEEEAI